MNVQAPDGKIISFPDGMSSSDIDAAMQQYHAASAGTSARPPVEQPTAMAAAEPLPAWQRVPLGLLASAAHGALVGAGAPGDLESLGVRYVANPISRYFGLQEDDPQATLLPKSSDMLSLVPGLSNALSGPLAPQSSLEREGQAVVGGAASAVPLALVGGGALAPQMIAGSVGGGAAEGAKQLGAPVSVQLAAGLAGGVGTQLVGAGTRTVRQVARDLGSSQTLDDAGSTLKAAAEDWRQNELPAQLATAEAPLNAAVPAVAVHVPSDLIDRSEELLARGGAAANAVRDFLKSTADSGGALGATAKQLQGDIASRALGTSASVSPITWIAGRDFRSELGRTMRSAHTDERPALEYLYGGATNDLGATAAANGAGDAFNDYNTVSTNLHALDSGPIQQILDAPTSGDAATRLLTRAKRSGDQLAALRAGGGGLSDAVDELGAAHLNMNPDGRSFARLSPEAQAALVPNEQDRVIVQTARPSKGEPGLTNKLLESVMGGELVGSGTELAATALGFPPRVGRAAGELAGNVAPWVWRGARNALLNPRVPAMGVVGATAAP